jgi:hypothetical protein
MAVKSAATFCVGVAVGFALAIVLAVLLDTSPATIERQRTELLDLRRQLDTAVERQPSSDSPNQQVVRTIESGNGDRVPDPIVGDQTAQNAQMKQEIVDLTKARDALAMRFRKATSDILDAKSDAERARLELSRLKQSLPTNDTDGHVPDVQFYFRNLKWTHDGPHVQIIGEMQNQTGADWDSAWFQIAGYDESNRLLGVSPFSISRFSSGMVKAFEVHLIDVPYSRGMQFKLTFEGGDEID